MKISTTLIFLSLTLTLTGQKVFLDKYKAPTTDPSNAKYYVLTNYESNPKEFKVTSYHITGEKESENNFITSSSKNAISYVWYLTGPNKKSIREGMSMTWYKSGQLESQKTYVNGKINGKALTWFENGRLKKEENYVDGNYEGKSFEWFDNCQLKEECNYVNSQYNGLIITYSKNGHIKRKDQYNQDKFQNGICYDSLGKEIKHFDLQIMPEYKGGDKKFFMDISNTLNYPANSRDKGIQGRVRLKFAITELGDISDIEIVEGINDELNKEALRVLSTAKKFKPGYYDGEPVKVYYMVPISFSLK